MLRARDIPVGVRRWLPPLAAAAAAVVVFLPILGFEFLEYDDLIYVFQNPLSKSFAPESLARAFLEPYFRSYSPLTLLTHAIDLRAWGENGGLHHLLNLLLHGANAVLLFRVALRLFGEGSPGVSTGGATLAAFSASLLFAVHPLQVEPVAWISGRKDVLMTFWLLSSFLAYLRWREAEDRAGGRDVGEGEGGTGQGQGGGSARGERGGGWPVASVVFFLFALLSKSTAFAFPLVLIVCDRLILWRRDPASVLIREKAVMLTLAFAAVVVAVLAGRGHDTSDLLAGFPPAARVLLPIFTPVFYLWQLIWPFGLTPFTPPASLHWVFLGAGATVVATAALVRRGQSGLLAAWLAYLFLLVPTIGGTFMETGMQPWADRFTYAPMVPVFIAIGGGLSRISRFHFRAALLVVLASAFAAVTRAQLGHWRNTEAVWTRVVQESPTLAKGHKNLASMRMSQGRTDEAIQLLRRAVALKPAYSEAHNDLGLALAEAGRLEEAVQEHRTAIALDSTRVEGYNSCGVALLKMGDFWGAYGVFRRGIDAHPGVAKLRFNAGTAALALGDTSSAIARFQETVALDSAAARAAEQAARLLDARGDADAASWYQRAAEAGSADAKAWLARRGIAPQGGGQ